MSAPTVIATDSALPHPLFGVRRLAQQPIAHGERWIFSAGFNVRRDLSDTGRIDSELADLGRLLSAGARVAILSHQGNYRRGTAQSLDFAAAYLSGHLGRSVAYVGTCCGAHAEVQAAALRPGQAALFGNTRMQPGEETNDAQLAAALARLGDRVAIGGFSKAHRTHASNVGLLEYRPGYIAESIVQEVERLAPWAGTKPGIPSVAILGGSKREKIAVGLDGFTQTYDVVVPTGVVLNVLLKAKGHDVGASDLGEDPHGSVTIARRVLARSNRAEIRWPREVLIARRVPQGYVDARVLPLNEPVPADRAIVDIVPDSTLRAYLQSVADAGGRLLLAGTPGLVSFGFRAAAEMFCAVLSTPNAKSIVVGGDSVADLAFRGRVSTGGGSALQYLVTGDSPVFAALRAQVGGIGEL